MAPLPAPKVPRTDLFYGGEWHAPLSEERRVTYNPGTGAVITDQIAWGNEKGELSSAPGWKWS